MNLAPNGNRIAPITPDKCKHEWWKVDGEFSCRICGVYDGQAGVYRELVPANGHRKQER